MSSGGLRKGAGRPAGAKNSSVVIEPAARRKITDALVEKVAGINITPLEVMLNDMKLHHDEARKLLAEHEHEQEDGERKGLLMKMAKVESALAVESAAKVAPYIHAKLQTTTLKGDADNPIELALMDASTLKAAVRGSK